MTILKNQDINMQLHFENNIFFQFVPTRLDFLFVWGKKWTGFKLRVFLILLYGSKPSQFVVICLVTLLFRYISNKTYSSIRSSTIVFRYKISLIFLKWTGNIKDNVSCIRLSSMNLIKMYTKIHTWAWLRENFRIEIIWLLNVLFLTKKGYLR